MKLCGATAACVYLCTSQCPVHQPAVIQDRQADVGAAKSQTLYVQVSCCNIHFINEGIFQVNTSQPMACFKADYSPEDIPRKLSLCTWTLLPEFPEVLIVPDALQDIRSYPHCLLFAHPLTTALVFGLRHATMHDSGPSVHSCSQLASHCADSDLWWYPPWHNGQICNVS